MRLPKFFNGSLRNRLVLYFTLLMMVPLSAAGYLIYMISDVRISDSAMKLATQIVEKDSKNIDEVLSDMQAAVQAVSKDEAIQTLLQSPRDARADREDCAYALGNRLKQISSLYRDINGLYIWLDDGILGKSRYYSPRESPLLTQSQYMGIRNHARPRWFAMEQGSLMVDNLGDAVLSMAASLSLEDTGQPCGIVIVEVTVDDGIVRERSQGFAEVRHRVEDNGVVAVIVAEFLSGKEVYEAFKYIATVIAVGDVCYTLRRIRAFPIRIAKFKTVGVVLKADGIIILAMKPIVNLHAILLCNLFWYPALS